MSISLATLPPKAKGRVLPTMNEDGTRRWVRPKPSHGKWATRRRIVAYALMAIYLAIPHLRMNGKPLMLLDAPRREFTLFGYTFLPTDTLLFMLLLGTIVVAVFLLTALFGRVWCGWGCPQTVWMEFLFRPIERVIEGGRARSMAIDKSGKHLHPRRLLKFAVYGILALVLAHTFLAYFVGVDALKVWVTRSPAQHPTSFAVMAITSALVYFDFAYFREQTCTIACPYGRWQSALLDKSSLIVAYDVRRGEPRQKGIKDRPATAGNCIDCGACVATCPTGIDIRDGLQMECIHCTQCADACDAIMDSIGKPRGLVRYSSREALAGEKTHILRPRTVLYPAALTVFLGSLVWGLTHKASADVTLLRGVGEPYSVESDGTISNQVRVKVANRSRQDRAYYIDVAGAEAGRVVIPVNPYPVASGGTETTSIFVILPRAAFARGERVVTLRVEDRAGFSGHYQYRLLGPEE